MPKLLPGPPDDDPPFPRRPPTPTQDRWVTLDPPGLLRVSPPRHQQSILACPPGLQHISAPPGLQHISSPAGLQAVSTNPIGFLQQVSCPPGLQHISSPAVNFERSLASDVSLVSAHRCGAHHPGNGSVNRSESGRGRSHLTSSTTNSSSGVSNVSASSTSSRSNNNSSRFVIATINSIGNSSGGNSQQQSIPVARSPRHLDSNNLSNLGDILSTPSSSHGSNNSIFSSVLLGPPSSTQTTLPRDDTQPSPRGSSPDTISLTVPRPDHQRATNLYVDTPFPHRPTPRRPPPTPPPTTTSPHLVRSTAPRRSHNSRSASPRSMAPTSPRSGSPRSISSRPTSPSNSFNSHLHNSSSNLLSHSSSTLPSVHKKSVVKSFVNPNSHNVINSYNSRNNRNNTNANNGSDKGNNNSHKLSSSSFSFSPSKSRVVDSGGVIIQTQPSAFSFTKSGGFSGSKYGGVGGLQFGGSGGIGGKSFNNSCGKGGVSNFNKMGGKDRSTSDLSKSMIELRGVTGNTGNPSRPGAPGYLGGNVAVQQSIICGNCGRCRCQACCTPKPTPSAWLCSGKCLCTPSSLVDCISCACCVKACLYHCGGEDDTNSHRPNLILRSRCSNSNSDQDDDSSRELPSCWQNKSQCAIWSCLILGAIPLPCLLCYFPLTALRRLLERGYRRCTSPGCRCPPPQQPNAATTLPPLDIRLSSTTTTSSSSTASPPT